MMDTFEKETIFQVLKWFLKIIEMLCNLWVFVTCKTFGLKSDLTTAQQTAWIDLRNGSKTNHTILSVKLTKQNIYLPRLEVELSA